jgi:hypothetical protein
MIKAREPFTDPPAVESPRIHLDRLLYPARFYSHPREVVADQTLSLTEKHAILSTWASGACAVYSMPGWRRLPGAPKLVSLGDVMHALQRLDEGDQEPRPRPSDGRRNAGGRHRRQRFQAVATAPRPPLEPTASPAVRELAEGPNQGH